jgi:hypothetical protein
MHAQKAFRTCDLHHYVGLSYAAESESSTVIIESLGSEETYQKRDIHMTKRRKPRPKAKPKTVPQPRARANPQEEEAGLKLAKEAIVFFGATAVAVAAIDGAEWVMYPAAVLSAVLANLYLWAGLRHQKRLRGEVPLEWSTTLRWLPVGARRLF